jgi:Glycosyl transferase family 11
MNKLVTFRNMGRYGRLANGMFSAAGCLGVARRNGFDFALCEPWQNHDGRSFEPDLDIDCHKRFVNHFPIYDGPELPQRHVPWGYHKVRLQESTDLLGHFQSTKYFTHCIDEVRWYYTMIGEGPRQDVVAVHWRAGDYGNDYHPRLKLAYYEQALQIFGSQQKFLVFSDDIAGAKAMFAQLPAQTLQIAYAETAGVDYLNYFRLLKRCTHFIIANSSYSAMAAVLADAPEKQVVAPLGWFGPAAGLDPKDIYEDDWHLIA